jgi:hypothetical protein
LVIIEFLLYRNERRQSLPFRVIVIASVFPTRLLFFIFITILTLVLLAT